MRAMSMGDPPIMEHFQYAHLNDELKLVSGLFHDLAWVMYDKLKLTPELSAGLRKLLEAKDCFVRQAAQEQRNAAQASMTGLTGGLALDLDEH